MIKTGELSPAWQQEKEEAGEETGSLFVNNLLPPKLVRYSNKVFAVFNGPTRESTSVGDQASTWFLKEMNHIQTRAESKFYILFTSAFWKP